MGTNYKYLSCEERPPIQFSLEQGCTLRVIARSLQRVPSSISRELQRNGWTNPTTGPRKRGRPPLAGGYRAPLAQQRAARLARTARCPSRLAQAGPSWPTVGLRRTIVVRSAFAATDLGHTVPNAAGRPDAPGQPRDQLHRALRHAAR